MKANIKISQFSRFLRRSEYAIQVKIWKWLKLLNSVPFIKKPLVSQVCIWIWSFWLTFTVLQWMKKNSKNSQFSSFLLRSGYAILVKTLKWLKLLNSVPFIKKLLLNYVYIRIWSSWLTFTVSQGMKANIKISQFSRFLLRCEYPIQVKIWKWLKLLNSVPFIEKPLINQVYFRIWSFWWLSQFYSEWRKTPKIVNFQDFGWGPSIQFRSKFENDLNFLILYHSSRNHLKIKFTFEFDHFDWLSQFYSEWRKTPKIVNFQVFC